jgi:hypothetical protein
MRTVPLTARNNLFYNVLGVLLEAAELSLFHNDTTTSLL